MAASSRITYSQSSPGGSHLSLAVAYTVKAKQEIARAKAIADSVAAGGVTPANLEGSQEFGAAAAGGGALYTAIANLSTNLNTATSAQLADLDSGN